MILCRRPKGGNAEQPMMRRLYPQRVHQAPALSSQVRCRLRKLDLKEWSLHRRYEKHFMGWWKAVNHTKGNVLAHTKGNINAYELSRNSHEPAVFVPYMLMFPDLEDVPYYRNNSILYNYINGDPMKFFSGSSKKVLSCVDTGMVRLT